VLLARTEAAVIAKAIGASINPDAGTALDPNLPTDEYHAAAELLRWREVAKHTDRSCSFLREGECSIDAHRPLACRLQISLHDDAEPCRLRGTGQEVRVPYPDTFFTHISRPRASWASPSR
jgi:hypothetical protein